MPNKTTPKGSIWETGVHNVSVDGEGKRVNAPQYSLLQKYNLMQRIIKEKGYIPIGVDHIHLDQFPILAKLIEAKGIDLHNVGKIKGIWTDGDKIKITDSEITEPTVQSMYENGDLPAWSVVDKASLIPCPSGKADLIADYFEDVERVDFVGRGGCETCLVEDGGVPTGYNRLNAKFMEVNNMVEEHEEQQENSTNESDEEEEESQEESNEEEEESEESSEEEEKPLTRAEVKQTITDVIKDIVPDMVKGETQKVEAKLADIEEGNKKDKVTALVEAKLTGGYVKPVQKDGLIKAGIAMKDEDFKELLAGYNDKLPLGERYSKEGNAPEEEEDIISEEDYLKGLGLK